MKKNCWEFKNCGRQAGGPKADEFGVCPAFTKDVLDGTHDGTNGGRACWVVAGTLCGGRVHGTFAKKYDTCITCDFFNLVKKEENGSYEMAITLLNRMGTFGLMNIWVNDKE